jgi:hypothetical protein
MVARPFLQQMDQQVSAGVFIAARRLRAKGDRVMFAPPIVWALHTIIWGMFVVLPYWLIHHSNLHADMRARAKQYR